MYIYSKRKKKHTELVHHKHTQTEPRQNQTTAKTHASNNINKRNTYLHHSKRQQHMCTINYTIQR